MQRSEPLVVDARVTIPARELTWDACRSSGPGGQNVNKVASKVMLRFDLHSTQAFGPAVKTRLLVLAKGRLDAEGCVLMVSQLTRDQSRNLDDAREKLAALIRQALIIPIQRRPTKPSRSSKEKRLTDKRQQAVRKQARGRNLDE